MNARHVASALARMGLVGAACAPLCAFADGDTAQTIVMVRHGEKPDQGLGQLSCQGLNRALALPRVIETKFGRPDAIFAPDPAKQKNDRGTKYDYVRPLATIEPTAIYFGLPVNASLGFKDIDKLADSLLSPNYRSSVVVVAWEHALVEETARRIVKRLGGDASSVPKWKSADFDSIYVVRVTHRAGTSVASFAVEREGLNGQSTACPVR
ncbi:histidine phosphatase family protein [Caballeronia sp. ATUFL_M2_KS44]|uniref:histidine phosphatase family protein n=1 Tax=Caballeronia sp. ATUFL_M2_KS44 TaxID=2921767 RepID=UPI00202925C3|nr:histidine phosphatase family protein [Caballeronia sp. ATUFL_M2_KS44]